MYYQTDSGRNRMRMNDKEEGRQREQKKDNRPCILCDKALLLLPILHCNIQHPRQHPLIVRVFVHGYQIARCLILYTCQQWAWLKHINSIITGVSTYFWSYRVSSQTKTVVKVYNMTECAVSGKYSTKYDVAEFIYFLIILTVHSFSTVTLQLPSSFCATSHVMETFHIKQGQFISVKMNVSQLRTAILSLPILAPPV